jgi:hypothetical protein
MNKALSELDEVTEQIPLTGQRQSGLMVYELSWPIPDTPPATPPG